MALAKEGHCSGKPEGLKLMITLPNFRSKIEGILKKIQNLAVVTENLIAVIYKQDAPSREVKTCSWPCM